MAHVPEPVDGVTLPVTAAAHLGYHIRMAAVFAVAGDAAESASESVLAWAMLATCWDDASAAASATAAELIDKDQASTSVVHSEAARARAEALAMELEAHYVSVGCHTEAALYETVAERLESTIATLVNTAG